MSEGENIWDVLGIPPSRDGREIRRAYSRKLKVTQPEDDPEGFQRLRMAYEHALAFAAHAAPDDSQPAPSRPPPADSHQATPLPPARPPAPIDAEIESENESESREVQGLFDTLRQRLEKNAREGWPDIDGDAKVLTALVRRPAPENVHLQLQVEEAIAVMLVQFAPHADHLLLTATHHFQWQYRLEGSLTDAARAVLERIDDLKFVENLQHANNEGTRAYETLKKPTTRLMRWLSAFDSHQAELAMLHYLRQKRPRLLAELPAENVSWYLNVGRLPRPSKPIAMLGVVVSVIVMMWVGFHTTDGEVGEHVSEAMFICLLCLFGVMVFDFFVLKLPPLLVEERWQGQPPAWMSWGWLVLSIGVVFGTVAMRDRDWAWYVFLGIAAVASYGALLVSGPVPKIQWRLDVLLDLRALRVVLMNLMVFLWLAIVFDEPLHLDPWLLVPFGLLLMGSGVSRPFLMKLFSTRLAPNQQASIAAAGLIAAIVLLACAWVFGRNAEFKPWLMAAVVAVVLVRRAIPHGIAINGKPWIGGIVVLGGWWICAWLSAQFNLEVREEEYGDPPILVCGALFFLCGAAYSFGRAIHDAVGELRKLRVA